MIALIGSARRSRRALACALRKRGVRVVDVESVATLPRRSFAVTIVLERLSPYELNVLRKRRSILIDVSCAQSGQIDACEEGLHAVGLGLACARQLVSNHAMRGEGGQTLARLRILILEDHPQLRSTLVRLFRLEASRRGIALDVDEFADFDSAALASQHQVFDVVIVDVSLGDARGRDGLVFLEELRARGFLGRAFVLTAMRDYSVEAKADALGARYIPKDNLDASDFISRVLHRSHAFPERPSSVRLKRVSREDVATFLACEPEGLQSALARARTDAVRQVVLECAGNRTAAARRLRMSRQQVQKMLDAADEDATESGIQSAKR